jgi:hypothetical protein
MAQERELAENTSTAICYQHELLSTPLQYHRLPGGGTVKRQIKYVEKGVLYPPDDANLANLSQDDIYEYVKEQSGQLEVSQSNLDDLSTDQLLAIIEAEESTITKARSLDILLARNYQNREQNRTLATAVYRQLIKNKLPISWRNTLLLALEHIQIEEPNLRRELSVFLLKLCPNMKDETYPRSYNALVAAFRTLPTLLDDANHTIQLLKFLSTEYTTKIRHIVLFGIRSMASLPIPGNIPEKVVVEIGNELACCARYLLRCSVSPTSEEEFDLGLDIVGTLIVLGYNTVPSLICELETLRTKWVIDQLNDTLSDVVKMWETRAPSFHKAKQNLIIATRKAIDSILPSS